MTLLEKAEKAISGNNIPGWLFFNFRHIDPISDRILGINPDALNSRGWFYILTANKKNLKIVHSVEKSVLDHLPGEVKVYTSREELKKILSTLRGNRFAMQSDINLSQISYLDSGTYRFLEQCGIKAESSAPLIHQTLGILNKKQIKSHEKTALILYSIIRDSWTFIENSFKTHRSITEKEVQEYILKQFQNNNLITSHPPLAASGTGTSNPHYSPGSKKIKKGELIQFDIWAKSMEKDSVYADISWVGYSGNKAPKIKADTFQVITAARDITVNAIKESLNKGNPLKGADADKAARKYLYLKGFSKNIKHRTGHAIDIELHGYGVNLDSVEFPDMRHFSEGSCFSVEPALYFNSWGMRTEINCYISAGKLYISGSIPQQQILLFRGSSG